MPTRRSQTSSLWSSITQKIGLAKQSIQILWATHQTLVIDVLKTVPSARGLKALALGIIHCLIQGALVSGLCAFGSMLSESIIGQVVLPGSLTALGQMGALALTALRESLPTFLQFVPTLISWSLGWQLLLVPVILIGIELYRKGLPENWNTLAYSSISIVAPMLGYAFWGSSLSSVFSLGCWLSSPWNVGVPMVTSLHLQYLDNANHRPISKRSNRRPEESPSEQPYYPRPAIPRRRPAAPITPQRDRANQKVKTHQRPNPKPAKGANKKRQP